MADAEPNLLPVLTRKRLLLILGGIVLAGAYFRLARLGLPALRADTMTFYKICQQNLSAGQIFSHWLKLGHSNQFPFPNAAAKWLIDLLGLNVTFFSVRLSSALWGVLAIPAAFGLGRCVGGKWVGLVLAALLAFNPYHIQMVREAYFYAPMLLGAPLMLWAMFELLQRASREVPAYLFAVAAGGLLLLTYSQPSGLLLMVPCLVVIVGNLLWRLLSGKKVHPTHVVMVVLCLLLLVPMFTAEWGWKQFAASRAQQSADFWAKTSAGGPRQSLWSMAFQMLTRFTWGDTPLRALLALAAVGLSLAVVWHDRKKDKQPLFLLMLFVTIFALFLIAQRAQHFNFTPRYVLPLLPVYLLLLAIGLVRFIDWPLSRLNLGPGQKTRVFFAVQAVALLPLVYPAYVCTLQTGRPTPYKAIVAWCDSHLPRGTLVLVDRWFEPWNELKVHASTNVVFTFTVPNEPLEQFKKVHWRDTAKAFVAKYPDAAVMEIAKSFSQVPEIGPWRWPHEHFREKEVIRNEAGLKLRHWGLAARGGFYSVNTNRLIVTIFYNNRDDLQAIAREQGKKLMLLYGNRWGYTKTEDYHDWRVLEDTAEVELYNLTDQPLAATLVMRALSLGGTKQMQYGPKERDKHLFEGKAVEQLRLGPVKLNPGLSRLSLTDPLWGLAKVPLLVDDLHLERWQRPSKPSEP